LQAAKLQRAQLINTQLETAVLRSAQLQGACLRYAKLEGADLHGAKLNRANLQKADLRGAILYVADLEEAHLQETCLRDANLTGGNLERADLRKAKLEDTILVMARFDRAKLNGANMDRANVRRATGILFDDNPFERPHINGDAMHPWSILRRKYTGPWFLIHLLLLVAFLLPYAAKVIYLSQLSEMQDTATELIARANEELTAMEATPVPKTVITNARQLLHRYQDTHKEVPAWWVLVGGSKGLLFVAMTTVIICYNVLRAYLTVKVSALRDMEEQTRVTPALHEYYGQCHPLADNPGWRSLPTEWLSTAARWFSGYKQRGWRQWQGVCLISPCRVIGLYRLHQIASWLLVGALMSLFGSSFHWLVTTWVWVAK
jgi:uncharacterized protein YjbI with pentapeptide repeats